MSVTHFLQNRKQQKNASRAGSLSRSATAPSRREPLICAFFHFVPQKKFLPVFRRFQNNPSPASQEPPLPRGSHETVENYGKYQERFSVPHKNFPISDSKRVFSGFTREIFTAKKDSIKILRNPRLFVHFSPSARRRMSARMTFSTKAAIFFARKKQKNLHLEQKNVESFVESVEKWLGCSTQNRRRTYDKLC